MSFLAPAPMAAASAAPEPVTPFDPHQVNSGALQSLARASATHPLVASRDIVDERRVKLWAAGRPVDPTLRERLLQRRLLRPLEHCLEVAGRFDWRALDAPLHTTLEGATTLGGLLRPHAAALSAHLTRLPDWPLTSLMAAVMCSGSRADLMHGVQALALAGGMAAALGLQPQDVRMAMLAGLLHDLGEIYLGAQPAAHAGRPPTLARLRHEAAHAHIARTLLAGCADGARELAPAIGAHHARQQVPRPPTAAGAAGRLLSIVECTLSLLDADPQTPRAELQAALKVVPGEFDLGLARLLLDGPDAEADAPGTAAEAACMAQQAAELGAELQRLMHAARALNAATGGDTQRRVAEQCSRRLEALHAGWSASGLWALDERPVGAPERHELRGAIGTMRRELQRLRAHCHLMAEQATPDDRQRLAPLWSGGSPVPSAHP